jgi:hypothetical protein
MSDIPAYLKTMFTDDRFKRLRERIYFAEIDGEKVGVVLATLSPNRDAYALNCSERERVLRAKVENRIHLAFVVAVKLTSFSKPPEFQTANHIEAVDVTGLRKLERRDGSGEFFLLQLDDIDPNRPL